MELIGKGSSYKIVRLENDVVICELFLEWSRDNHMTSIVMKFLVWECYGSPKKHEF
jgi:hypothetical protein